MNLLRWTLFEGVEKTVVEQPSLYELLLQRQMLLNKINEVVDRHSVVRKSDRYPSLRLRFGKRSNPAAEVGASPADQQH